MFPLELLKPEILQLEEEPQKETTTAETQKKGEDSTNRKPPELNKKTRHSRECEWKKQTKRSDLCHT